MDWEEKYINKVVQGDCINVMCGIPDNTIDMILTSPPYNKHSAKRICKKDDTWKKSNIDYGEYNDDMPEQEYQEWQKKVLKECIRILNPNGSIFYNHKPRTVNHSVVFPQEWLGEFIIREMIIWDRGNSPNIDPVRFMPTVEYIFWITKERKTPKFNKRAFSYTEIWRIPPKVDTEHPATFPLEIALRCIKSTTDRNDIVLDCFLGSGTTAIACIETSRRFIGIELNPEYCNVANKRIKISQDNLRFNFGNQPIRKNG